MNIYPFCLNHKDLDFGLPIAALVLVPTHELCMQVYETLDKMLHRLHWLVPGYIMGGESRAKEKARLRKGTTNYQFISDTNKH